MSLKLKRFVVFVHQNTNTVRLGDMGLQIHTVYFSDRVEMRFDLNIHCVQMIRKKEEEKLFLNEVYLKFFRKSALMKQKYKNIFELCPPLWKTL